MAIDRYLTSQEITEMNRKAKSDGWHPMGGMNRRAFTKHFDGALYLRSYNTIVASIDENGFHRHWSGWSATTAKHYNAFLEMNYLNRISKAEWCELPVERY
jgi:hypothetical protein